MSTLKKILTVIVVLTLLVGAIAISSLNAGSVELNLYWYKFSLPMGFMLLTFGALGLLFGMIMSWLIWTWPANKRKTYWEREYFKLKQLQDEQVEAIKYAGSIENAVEDSTVIAQLNKQS